MPTPEQLARKNIDDLLDKCGWIVQSRAGESWDGYSDWEIPQ